MADLFCSTLTELRAVSSSGLVNLTEAYVGALRQKFIWINNEGGTDDGVMLITPSDNPASGRWICPQAPAVASQTLSWSKIDKTSSTLGDLESRSAGDLNEGTLQYQRLPSGVPYFSTITPSRIVTTNEQGNFQLSTIDFSQIDGSLSFARLDWDGFLPSQIGAEGLINFKSDQFDRDSENNVAIKVMNSTQAGLAMPGTGISAGDNGRINVIYGTGESQALEGTTPLGGDLSGEHSAAVVDALRNIPLTFHFNDVSAKNGFAITLNSENENNPYFYLSKMTDIPDWTNKKGVLTTDGSTLSWQEGGTVTVDFSFKTFTCSYSTLELGQTAYNPAFTMSFNGTPVSVAFSDTAGNSGSSVSPFTDYVADNDYVLTSKGNITFTALATDSDGNTCSNSLAISWVPRVYWGTAEESSDYVSLINALQNSLLLAGRATVFTVAPGDLAYIYYAAPTSYGTPIFSVGGFVGGFQLVASGIEITNQYNVKTTYDLYRSDYSDLGSTTVTVS